MTTFDLQFDPIDWQQLELLAKLTPGERMRASVMAHEFAWFSGIAQRFEGWRKALLTRGEVG